MQPDMSIRPAAPAQFNKIWQILLISGAYTHSLMDATREAQISSPFQQFNTFSW